MSMDQLANVPIESLNGYFAVDAGSRMDAETDVVDSWLYEADSFPHVLAPGEN